MSRQSRFLRVFGTVILLSLAIAAIVVLFSSGRSGSETAPKLESRAQSSHDVPVAVRVLTRRVERVSQNEARLGLKLMNESARPVFLEGINFGEPIVTDSLVLEQWREAEGWHVVAPCPDTPSPHVIELKPGEAMDLDRVLTNPIGALCKERNVRFEGKFRFRLDWFRTEEAARTYVKRTFSGRLPSVRAEAAVSEPFEIPPAK